MIRKIIHIDEEKCNGCGLCASACHEGAIDLVGGKARLVRENFCDGFGDCLPGCPTGAITFEEREAPAYDEAAVKEAQMQKNDKAEEDKMTTEEITKIENEEERRTAMMKHLQEGGTMPHGGCPGSRTMQMKRKEEATENRENTQQAVMPKPVSRLNQ